MNYPCNIWVINETDIREFGYTGGKIIYIVDTPEPEFANNPFIVTAGALLPPFEAIQAELDDDIEKSIFLYESYLQEGEPSLYIASIIAACVNNIPIGILFGKDEQNMQFPKVFINFLFKYCGIVLGVKDKVRPYILDSFMPINLAKIYAYNLISYESFILKHPVDAPIHDSIIPKLAYDINPFVMEQNHENYKKYFENVIRISHIHNRIPIEPLKGTLC